MKALTALLLLVFAGLGSSTATAHYREACWVKVSIDSHAGRRSRSVFSTVQSPVYAVQCNYLTGRN